MLALNACAQKRAQVSINLTPMADLFSGTIDLNFGLSPQLLHPYFVYARSEGSGETAHVRRLV